MESRARCVTMEPTQWGALCPLAIRRFSDPHAHNAQPTKTRHRAARSEETASVSQDTAIQPTTQTTAPNAVHVKMGFMHRVGITLHAFHVGLALSRSHHRRRSRLVAVSVMRRVVFTKNKIWFTKNVFEQGAFGPVHFLVQPYRTDSAELVDVLSPSPNTDLARSLNRTLDLFPQAVALTTRRLIFSLELLHAP